MKVCTSFLQSNLFLKLTAALLLSIVLAACGDGGESDPAPVGATGGTTGGTTGGGSGVTALEGTWKKTCGIGEGEDPANPNAFYDAVTLTFIGNNFDSDIKNYSDTGCSMPIPVAPNPTAKGTFTVGNSLTTTGGLQASEIDTHITEFNGAPFDIDDFDIFHIDVNTLYFGDISGAKDGTSSALRPGTLDFNRVFRRQ